MAIEQEFYTFYTGLIGNVGITGAVALLRSPTTGPNGAPDVAVDPTIGPAQRYNIDFGVTYMGDTGVILFDIPNSDIKSVLLNPIPGFTGPLTVRILYNY